MKPLASLIICAFCFFLSACGVPKIRYEGMDLHETDEVVAIVMYHNNEPEDFTELPGSFVVKISSETPIFSYARKNDFWVQDQLNICGTNITIKAWSKVDPPDYETDPKVGDRYQYSYLFKYKYDETSDYFRPPYTEHDQKVFNLLKNPQRLCMNLRFARYLITFIPRRSNILEFEIPPDVMEKVRAYDKSHPPDPAKKAKLCTCNYGKDCAGSDIP